MKMLFTSIEANPTNLRRAGYEVAMADYKRGRDLSKWQPLGHNPHWEAGYQDGVEQCLACDALWSE